VSRVRPESTGGGLAAERFAQTVHEPRGVEQVVTDVAEAYADRGEPLELLFGRLEDLLGTPDSAGLDEQVVRVAAFTWAGAVVGRLNRLTCVDPSTGLSSVQHLLAQMITIFGQAGGRSPSSDYSLLVVDVVDRMHRLDDQPFVRALRMAVVADSIDGWFGEPSVVRAALGPARVVLLVPAALHSAEMAVRLATHVTKRLRLSPASPVARTLLIPLPPDLSSSVALVEHLRADWSGV
jgi:hypothetical protein